MDDRINRQSAYRLNQSGMKLQRKKQQSKTTVKRKQQSIEKFAVAVVEAVVEAFIVAVVEAVVEASVKAVVKAVKPFSKGAGSA